MDFKEEQDEIFAQISKIRKGEPLEESETVENLNNRLAILTGTSLWLLSNQAEIEDAEDFRRKIDSFQKVLNSPAYLGMERNLCVASGIVKHLNENWESETFSDFMTTAEISTDLDSLGLAATAKKRYAEAATYFSILSQDEEIKEDADNCHFAMNFKFDGDCGNVETTYSAVSVFRDIAGELEQIYEKKIKESSKDFSADLSKKHM